MTKKEAIEILKDLYGLPPKAAEALDVVLADIDKRYTIEPPTVPGMYAWRSSHKTKHIWMEVWPDLLNVNMLFCGNSGRSPKLLGGEWCGPLTPEG